MDRTRHEVCYLCFDWLMPSSVIESQIIRFLLALVQHGYAPRLIVPSAFLHDETLRLRSKRRKELAISSGIHLTSVLLPRLGRDRWSVYYAAFRLLFIVGPLAMRSKRVVLHCRNDIAGYVGTILQRIFPRRIQVVLDIRGELVAELLESRRSLSKREVTWIRTQQAAALSLADRRIMVSSKMQDHFRGRPDDLVLPCPADESLFFFSPVARSRIRKKLHLDDKRVLVYCGSLQEWQIIDEVLHAVHVWSRIEPSVFFLMLTNETEEAERLISTHLAKHAFLALGVPSNQVAEYLSASDVGLLLRMPSIVNYVASPVKFSEYMMTGLPVLITEGIGDASEETRTTGQGATLRSLSDSDIECAIRSLIGQLHLFDIGWRERVARESRRRFALGEYVKRVVEVYETVGSKAPEYNKSSCGIVQRDRTPIRVLDSKRQL